MLLQDAWEIPIFRNCGYWKTECNAMSSWQLQVEDFVLLCSGEWTCKPAFAINCKIQIKWPSFLALPVLKPETRLKVLNFKSRTKLPLGYFISHLCCSYLRSPKLVTYHRVYPFRQSKHTNTQFDNILIKVLNHFLNWNRLGIVVETPDFPY